MGRCLDRSDYETRCIGTSTDETADGFGLNATSGFIALRGCQYNKDAAILKATDTWALFLDPRESVRKHAHTMSATSHQRDPLPDMGHGPHCPALNALHIFYAILINAFASWIYYQTNTISLFAQFDLQGSTVSPVRATKLGRCTQTFQMPKRAREDPCAICGHWHDYEGGEPCTVCGHTLARHDNSANKGSAFPTEILPGFLYLGSYDNASRSELLKTVGITHILNTVPACQNLYKNSFQYHTVSCKPPDYDECFTYLDAVQQEKGRVLVHCMTGTSSSPSVVIGYLMRLRRWRLSDSYKWVHDRRAVVSLQEGEAARLQQLEVQLLGESSTGFKVEAAQQSPGGPFAWSAWRDAPQPSPPALVASQPYSSFGQPNHTSSSNFVFGGASPELLDQSQHPATNDL